MPEATRLILASGSAARKAMLEAAGLTFDVVPADVDEAGLREAMSNRKVAPESAEIAAELAAEKARSVSEANPKALVIGADQILALGGKVFAKARDSAEARDILVMLRGRTHELVSAVALARGGTVHWQTTATADMAMRDFTDEFIGSYLERMGDRALQSVGCYEIEGLGIQLFDHIDGDYFTILGIPLLPLLARLRQEEMVAA
jgi:septum formation protein